MTPGRAAQTDRARRARRRSAVCIIAIWAALAMPLILSGFVKGRGAWDQLNYHEQVVRAFAEQLPSPDFSNYLSATTPGYHTLLAVVARVIDDSRTLLQLTGSMFAVGLFLLLVYALSGGRRPQTDCARAAWWLALPLAVSMPVFYASVWMLPDNAGWLGVLAVWLLALRPRFDAVTVVAGAVLLAVLVFVRQIHLWPWAMLLTAAWIGSSGRGNEPFDFGQDSRELLTGIPARLGRVGLMLVAGLPAVAVVFYFWSLWGRTLTPPVFDERHVGLNTTAPAFVLAVFGGWSLFFLPFLADGLRRLWVRHTWLLALALLLGLVFALAAPTTYSTVAGRSSGLWDIARKLPTPLDRSVLVVPLAVIGSVLVSAWFVSLGRRDRWVMLAALVAFTAAQCASFKLWQRYSEPFVLIWLALAASRVPLAASAAWQGWRVVGVAGLVVVQAAVTAASLWMAGPVRPRDLLFPGETEAPQLPGMVAPPWDRSNRAYETPPNGRSTDEWPEDRSQAPD